MSDGLEELLRKHQADLQSEGGFACWECGDVKDPAAHQAKVLRDAGLVGEAEYSVRYDSGNVEHHVFREKLSALRRADRLAGRGVSATVVRRSGPGEWEEL